MAAAVGNPELNGFGDFARGVPDLKNRGAILGQHPIEKTAVVQLPVAWKEVVVLLQDPSDASSRSMPSELCAIRPRRRCSFSWSARWAWAFLFATRFCSSACFTDEARRAKTVFEQIVRSPLLDAFDRDLLANGTP